MKTAVTIVLLALATVSHAQWLPRETTSARAFVYDSSQEGEYVTLWQPNRFHKGIINKGGAKLSDKQFERLKQAMRSAQKREPGAFCYEPHHGFVFYDAEGVAMGHIELCFLCGNVESSPKGLPNVEWNWVEMEKILEELNLPILNKSEAYTELFTGEVDAGYNTRDARTVLLELPDEKTESFDVPAGVYFSKDEILTLHPGDTVYLEFEENDGKFTDPSVAYKPRNRDRTIIFKLTQDEKGTKLSRATQIQKTIALDCEIRVFGSEEFNPMVLRPNKKGLTIYNSWPPEVCEIRLKNIEISDRSAEKVYQEKLKKSKGVEDEKKVVE